MDKTPKESMTEITKFSKEHPYLTVIFCLCILGIIIILLYVGYPVETKVLPSSEYDINAIMDDYSEYTKESNPTADNNCTETMFEHIYYNATKDFYYFDNIIKVWFVDGYTEEDVNDVFTYLNGKSIECDETVNNLYFIETDSLPFSSLELLCENIKVKFTQIEDASIFVTYSIEID